MSLVGKRVWPLLCLAAVAAVCVWTVTLTEAAGPPDTGDVPIPPRATMNILYCYSCGYRKVFDDYAGIIQQKYPEISVFGANYDPPGIKMYLSRFIGFAKMILIFSILSNVQIFAIFNRPQPSWWTWCTENKLYACMMLYFLSNTLETQLVSSGAFEISLNDIPIWSKIETGRMPNPPELFPIIDNTLTLSVDYTA